MTSPIAFVGLGKMGLPMAERLLEAGFTLRIFNRSPDKAAALAAKGAILAASPAEAARGCEIAVTMVSDDAALDAVTLGPDGMLAGLAEGAVHLSMSSVSTETAWAMLAAHAARGVGYVACPVFGRPEAAAAGKLWLVAAGDSTAKARLAPVFAALGQGTYDFGDDPAIANLVKLGGNTMIAAAMEAMAEVFTLGEAHGVDRRRMASLFAETLFACPVYKGYGEALAQFRSEPVGFRLALGLKDVRLALRAADSANVPMPLASLLHDRLLGVAANGRADADWTAIADEVSRQAGLR